MRRKAAAGGTSDEFFCYLRVPIYSASSEKSFLSSDNCCKSGGTLMLAQKRLDPSLNTQGGKDEERQMCLGDEAYSR